MTPTQAITHLKFSYEESRATPKMKEQDRLALNSLIIEINHLKAQLEQTDSNEFFKKLYINVFKNIIIRNGGNVKGAVETIKTILRIDLTAQVDALVLEINHLSPTPYPPKQIHKSLANSLRRCFL